MGRSDRYLIPSETHSVEIVVVNSRFIATAARVENAEEARAFLESVPTQMPDASHHVHAFRVGYGNSVTEGMSDDGEPSGTAGPPVLSVLRGTEIGDAIVVVTRYFGGTKLGTGGLVRAYCEAARTVLSELPTEWKVEKQKVMMALPYTYFEQIKRLIEQYNGIIEDQDFAADVTLTLIFPLVDVPAFTESVTELTSGQVEPLMLD